MDRKAAHDELYALVSQPLQDGVTLALRSYSNRASAHPDMSRWEPIREAAGRIGDAFEQVRNDRIPLAGALRNLATRSIELKRIALGLDPTDARHAEVIDRLERAIGPLKDRAAELRMETIASGLSR